MTKKRITTVQEIDTDTPPEKKPNPITGYVKEFLNGDGVYRPELQALHYTIAVYKYSRDMKPVRVTGRVYDDLEKLPDQLGMRFGEAKFKLLITPLDSNENRLPFIKIEEFETVYDGDADPFDEQHPEDEQPIDVRSLDVTRLKIKEMELNAAKEIKQMELQAEMIKAIAQSKGGGGGFKPTDMLELIQTGISIGQGQPILPAATADGNDIGLPGWLNNPIIQQLLAKVIEAAGTKKNEPQGSNGQQPAHVPPAQQAPQ